MNKEFSPMYLYTRSLKTKKICFVINTMLITIVYGKTI